MRDVQNVDIAHAPHFRSGILRVDDRVQDAKSFAKSMRAYEREKEESQVGKKSVDANSRCDGNFYIFETLRD